MDTLVVPPVQTEDTVILKDGQETIELYDHHLRIYGRRKVRELSEDNVPVEYSYDYDIRVGRDKISSIKLIYNNGTGKYQIEFVIIPEILSTIMPSRKFGEQVLDKLTECLYK